MPLTPDQAHLFLHEATLPQILNEHPVTKAVIAAIPAETSGFKPDPIVKSAFELAWHIVSADIRFIEGPAAGAFDYGNTTPPDSVRTPADIVSWYRDRFGEAIAGLKRATGEDLLRPIDFRGVLTFPAYAYLQIGMAHTIHHRGQLSTYLRPMGAKVPSIYGESYDAREARERAARS